MTKRLLAFALLLGVVACDSKSESPSPLPSFTVENFDKAFDGDYSFGYTNEAMLFEYFYDEEYGYWGGFVQSKMFDTDPKNGLYENQYCAFNSGAASGDSFLLYYYDSYNEPCDIVCIDNVELHCVKLNLTTYTYASITDEDINTFARAFEDGDYLKVIFTPYDAEGLPAGDSVECYVVDYRNGHRFVANEWHEFPLNLPSAYRIRVTIETTDVGEWGANTPLYIGMDDLEYEIL